MQVFKRLLLNSLISGITSSFLWFAITFWVFLETRSVVATSVIGGTFAIASAFLGMFFGTFVDRHRKKHVMMLATSISLVSFCAAASIYAVSDHQDLLNLRHASFWILVFFSLSGSVAGNMRGIAMSTCVSLLVPEAERDRANGMVGTVTGVSFTVTSVFSGLVIGRLGMGWALGLSVGLTAVALVHLITIDIPEATPEPASTDGANKWIDVRGATTAIRQTPGLMALVFFAAFNNLLGGVFMSLMDAYGLSLVSVETWGLLWGVLSTGFIFGGLIVAKRGLGPRPLRIIFAGNLINWTICAVFTLRSSVPLLAVGMFLWLVSIPVIEAAEQTVMQRAVPFEQQGRVFGFAQTIENLASPMSSFLIGPIAELIFIPFMTTGSGVDLIGSWFGVGQERGLALIFTLAGFVGVVATAAAWSSRSYRALAGTVSPTGGPATAA